MKSDNRYANGNIIMGWRRVNEEEFRKTLETKVNSLKGLVNSVTGPGRSGAVCAAYVSHMLRIPFIPYSRRMKPVEKLQPILLIDTAQYTGKTLRKAKRNILGESIMLHLYDEPPMIRFFYE